MRIGIVVVVVAVLSLGVAVSPASACSCAEATLDDMLGRHPDAAVALVRRVDDGARREVGTLEVVGAIHGELPPRVTVRLDDGGSCRPALAPRQLATLSFRPDGNGWEAVECGMLGNADALERLYGPLDVDPDASGPPAAVVAGDLPGADLVALDAELRVLGLADVDGWLERMIACGDDLVTFRLEDPAWVVERWSLPELVPTARARLTRPDGWQLLAARCDDAGRVQAVAAEDLPGGSTLVHRDLLDSPADVLELPHGGGATFVGDEAWVVLGGDDADRQASIGTVDTATGAVGMRRSFAGLAVHELTASPDGRHATLRGFAEEPVLMVVDTATATPLGQLTGWWMPVHAGWLGPDRLLLHDESREMGEPMVLRVVDERLRLVEEITGSGGWPLALAGDHLLVGGGSELGVRRPDGAFHLSPDLRLAAAQQALVVGALRGPTEASAPPPPVTAAPPDAPAPPAWQLAAATVATIGAVGALVVLRRRRRERSPRD